MLTRREIILGGALTLIWGNCACAQTGARPHGFGCTLEPEEAEAFFATATEPEMFDNAHETLISSTGNREFDYALARTLSRLTDIFGVLPGFGFYDDYDNENAYATPATKLRRADGTVLIGKRYFISAMKKQESPEIGLAATCAHEFGHIVQYKYKLDKRLSPNTATRSDYPSFPTDATSWEVTETDIRDAVTKIKVDTAPDVDRVLMRSIREVHCFSCCK